MTDTVEMRRSAPAVMTAMTVRRLAAGASLVALAVATPAMAQVEEIIVTANKVAENVQDVPIAVTAVTGDALEAAGTTSLENIGDLVPSVTFRKGTTSANSAIFLRGVGTITFSIAAEPSVSTVVDGIVLSRSGQAFADLVDVERIEVLRGPQGTLFGKNASAGLVNIVSKGGSDVFEGEANLGLFEGGEYRGRLTVAGPIAEGLTARVTGFYGSYKGNITNVFNGSKVNGYERYGARMILDWEASDTAKFRLIADGFRANDDCCAEVTGVTRGAVLDRELNLPGLNLSTGIFRGENERFVNHNLTTRTQDRQWSLTAQGDFDVFSGHTLTMIGGYRNWRNVEFREGDFLPRAVVGTAELHDHGAVETDQYSLELRLASDQAKAFRYQVGGFYWQSDNFQAFRRDVTTCASSSLAADPRTGAVPCNLASTVTTLYPSAYSLSNVDVQNFALFGQFTVDVTEKLSLTGGLRWTKDELDYVHFRAPGSNRRIGGITTGPGISGVGAGGTLPLGNGTNTSVGSSSNDNISGKAVIQYAVTDDVMTYASYTRGYKGPAFNVFFNHTVPTNSVPIDEETSNAYEAGIKSRFADNRVQLNLAVFQADYNGFQANNFILFGTPPTIISNLTNAGSVRTKGFELDALINAADGLNFNANIAMADAKVRRFNPNPLTNAPDARNGTRLPLAPKWSSNIGMDYEGDLSKLGVDARIYFATNFNWTGKQFSDLGNSGPIDGYAMWNASLGFSDQDDKYRLTFHLKNITDDSYVLLNTSNGQRLHIPRDADRYAGVTLRVGFGGK